MLHSVQFRKVLVFRVMAIFNRGATMRALHIGWLSGGRLRTPPRDLQEL